jgi:hypothetical protein
VVHTCGIHLVYTYLRDPASNSPSTFGHLVPHPDRVIGRARRETATVIVVLCIQHVVIVATIRSQHGLTLYSLSSKETDASVRRPSDLLLETSCIAGQYKLSCICVFQDRLPKYDTHKRDPKSISDFHLDIYT